MLIRRESRCEVQGCACFQVIKARAAGDNDVNTESGISACQGDWQPVLTSQLPTRKRSPFGTSQKQMSCDESAWIRAPRDAVCSPPPRPPACCIFCHNERMTKCFSPAGTKKVRIKLEAASFYQLNPKALYGYDSTSHFRLLVEPVTPSEG